MAADLGPVPQCVDSTWKLPNCPLRAHGKASHPNQGHFDIINPAVSAFMVYG